MADLNQGHPTGPPLFPPHNEPQQVLPPPPRRRGHTFLSTLIHHLEAFLDVAERYLPSPLTSLIRMVTVRLLTLCINIWFFSGIVFIEIYFFLRLLRHRMRMAYLRFLLMRLEARVHLRRYFRMNVRVRRRGAMPDMRLRIRVRLVLRRQAIRRALLMFTLSMQPILFFTCWGLTYWLNPKNIHRFACDDRPARGALGHGLGEIESRMRRVLPGWGEGVMEGCYERGGNEACDEICGQWVSGWEYEKRRAWWKGGDSEKVENGNMVLVFDREDGGVVSV